MYVATVMIVTGIGVNPIGFLDFLEPMAQGRPVTKQGKSLHGIQELIIDLTGDILLAIANLPRGWTLAEKEATTLRLV